MSKPDPFKFTVTDAFQFVKVSVTNDGKPSNIQSSGRLTAISCRMLEVELERHGYFICKMPGGVHTGHCPTCGCEPIALGQGPQDTK